MWITVAIGLRYLGGDAGRVEVGQQAGLDASHIGSELRVRGGPGTAAAAGAGAGATRCCTAAATAAAAAMAIAAWNGNANENEVLRAPMYTVTCRYGSIRVNEYRRVFVYVSQ